MGGCNAGGGCGRRAAIEAKLWVAMGYQERAVRIAQMTVAQGARFRRNDEGGVASGRIVGGD